jgi:hypothetical protein
MHKIDNLIQIFFISTTIIITCFVCSINDASANQIKTSILFDGSGSMKGFFTVDSILDIHSKVNDILSSVYFSCEKSYVFVSSQDQCKFYPLETFVKKPVWGAYTRLDLALKKVEKSQIVVMITDNVQDVENYTSSSTRAFYQILEKDEFQTVLLCPLKYNFDGPLFFSQNRHPNFNVLITKLKQTNRNNRFEKRNHFNSKKYHGINMQGDKALALYIIIRKSLQKNDLYKIVSAAEKIFDNQSLIVKPIDQGKFFIEPVNVQKDVIKSFDELNRICKISHENEYIIESPNLSLKRSFSNSYQISLEKNSHQYDIVPYRYTPYHADDQMVFRHYFKVLNQSDSIVLGHSEDKCLKQVTIKNRNMACDIHPGYRDCFKIPKKIHTIVTPGYIARKISKENNDNGLVMSNEIYMPPLIIKQDFKTLFKLSLTKEIHFRIKGTLEIVIPHGEFHIDKQFKEQCFTLSTYDMQRIYTPEDIVSYIQTLPSRIHFNYMSKNLILLVPQWIHFIFYVMLSVLTGFVLLIVFTLWCHFRVYYLKRDDTGEAISIHLSKPYTTGRCMKDDDLFFIKRHLTGYRIYPHTNYHLTDNNDKHLSSITLPVKEYFHIRGADIGKIIIEKISSSEFKNSSKQTNIIPIKTNKNHKKKLSKENKTTETKNTTHDVDTLFGKQ